MQRFYFDIELWSGLNVNNEDFFKQVSFVLRSRVWDKIILFNWDSFDYIYEINNISKRWIELKFLFKNKNDKDFWICLTLFQALPNKYEKIEYILQKWVEVGIGRFVFFESDRSSWIIINDNKVKRFNLIIKEALEQCGGNIFPEIIFLKKWDKKPISKDCINIVTHTDFDWLSLQDLVFENKNSNINIWVWPEWWWSNEEVKDFVKNEFTFVSFGKRILRTETVGVVLGFWLNIMMK